MVVQFKGRDDRPWSLPKYEPWDYAPGRSCVQADLAILRDMQRIPRLRAVATGQVE